jgi:seryl-tRNA synthetase
MAEPKSPKREEDFLSSRDLELILSVNKKGIEINLEVERQNEKILTFLEELKENGTFYQKKLEEILDEAEDVNRKVVSTDKSSIDEFEDIKNILDKIEDTQSDVKKKIEELERANFKLQVLLGSSIFTSLAGVVQLIIQFTHK